MRTRGDFRTVHQSGSSSIVIVCWNGAEDTVTEQTQQHRADCNFTSVHPSVCPSIHCFSGSCHGGSSFSRVAQASSHLSFCPALPTGSQASGADVVSPGCPRSSLGSPPGGTYLEPHSAGAVNCEMAAGCSWWEKGCQSSGLSRGQQRGRGVCGIVRCVQTKRRST